MNGSTVLVLGTLSLVVAALVLVGCRRTSTTPEAEPATTPAVELDNEEDIPPAVREAMKKVVAAKSVALNDATVIVHHAYEYHGPTEIETSEEGKIIAVDAGSSGYTQNFKLWDVDIIDAADNENFGSDPDIAFLDENGKFLAFESDNIDFERPIRLLMIYAVPKTTSAIKLGYWGRELTKEAIPLGQDGLQLPKRD